MMSITGDPAGQPSKTGASLSDGIAGTFAMAGILGALYQRHETGLGQFIDVSMADCLLSLIFDEPFECYGDLGLAHRQGNRIARFSPFNIYRAADGAVAIGAGTTADWTKLLEIMGRQDLLKSVEFMNTGWRIENNDQVDGVVGRWAESMPVDDIISRLDEADITCGPIRTIDDVVGWDQLRARNMLQPVRNPHLPLAAGPLAAGFPLKFSEADAVHDPRVPMPREHNTEIYEGLLRLSKQEIAGLCKAGIV